MKEDTDTCRPSRRPSPRRCRPGVVVVSLVVVVRFFRLRRGNSAAFFLHRVPREEDDEDIELELGRDFTRALNFDKTAEDKAYKCLTWPVYNWEEKRVQVLEVTQISISRQFVKYGLHKTYSKNLLDWDFQMEKGSVGGKTKYDLMVIPRDEDEHDDIQMAKDWKTAQKAGFDLKRLIVGGDPFKEA